MTQFVEWNFQKSSRADKKLRLRKDHASYPIISKLLEKFNAGKEMKDMMPVKTAVRYIYNIYMGKANEFASEKSTRKPFGVSPARQDQGSRSTSPNQKPQAEKTTSELNFSLNKSKSLFNDTKKTRASNSPAGRSAAKRGGDKAASPRPDADGQSEGNFDKTRSYKSNERNGGPGASQNDFTRSPMRP